jgi:hypothetical protein
MAAGTSSRHTEFATLSLEDFCRIFDAKPWEFSKYCKKEMSSRDFRFRLLEGGERERAFLSALRVVDSGMLTTSGPQKKARWEEGWAENLADFVEKKNISSLVPKYARHHQPLRLEGQYIQPVDPEFENSFLTVLHTFVFEKYLSDATEIFEFGCGTGINLVELANIFPKKKLHGLDWVEPSKHIVERLSSQFEGRIQGHIFDMFSPDPLFRLPRGSAVFTAGALEQLGTRFDTFLEFLLDRKPKICVHVEPLYELYDENSLFDYAAARFSLARNWLRGFLPRMRGLESEGEIEILKSKRTIGSFFHDGYSIFVWHPSDKRQ